jgi:hypothetical protein
VSGVGGRWMLPDGARLPDHELPARGHDDHCQRQRHHRRGTRQRRSCFHDTYVRGWLVPVWKRCWSVARVLSVWVQLWHGQLLVSRDGGYGDSGKGTAW